MEATKDDTKKVHPMADPDACKSLKDKHDACFFKWYSEKFLKGTISIECKDEWEEYQYCLKDKLKAWNLGHLQTPTNKSA
eukprot:TRINITY_DN23819_c0_g1_i1.p1 TRINITY_DN23819_c0_g1~~TRINITY_DN23819_c0_g1_i1.p1  ORF type:complete len:80 (+),score=9.92 TRINITY_DN23819_c0_g1_i1:55-294(+)